MNLNVEFSTVATYKSSRVVVKLEWAVTSPNTDKCISTTALTASCQNWGLVQWIVLLLANYHSRFESRPLQAKWDTFLLINYACSRIIDGENVAGYLSTPETSELRDNQAEKTNVCWIFLTFLDQILQTSQHIRGWLPLSDSVRKVNMLRVKTHVYVCNKTRSRGIHWRLNHVWAVRSTFTFEHI